MIDKWGIHDYLRSEAVAMGEGVERRVGGPRVTGSWGLGRPPPLDVASVPSHCHCRQEPSWALVAMSAAPRSATPPQFQPHLHIVPNQDNPNPAPSPTSTSPCVSP